MARRTCRVPATQAVVLQPCQTHCASCGHRLWVAYHSHRTVVTLQGNCGLTIVVRHCPNRACAARAQGIRPEAEGGWALPQSEFGLDVIALVGTLRYTQQRSVPQIHQALRERGVAIAERTVTTLLYRYEELVAVHLADAERLGAQLAAKKRVILAIDGLQPDVGQEVLWVIRDTISGTVLLARSLLGATEADLVPLLTEVRERLELLGVTIAGVISDGQLSIDHAVQAALPAVPHQLCQFHYLREAARLIFEADRHAKKALKKQLRGIRPIERALEGSTAESEAITRQYCLAVRSALTDDGYPPLSPNGLRLQERMQAVADSVGRLAEKGGSPGSSRNYNDSLSLR